SLPLAGPQKHLNIHGDNLGNVVQFMEREHPKRFHAILNRIADIVAESVLAVWRKKPHQAKFRRREHFGKLYDDIFKNLNAAQALLAVLIFRHVENERKRPTTPNPASFLPYASHYLSMLIGRHLLKDRGTTMDQVSHRNFQEILKHFEDNRTKYHNQAVETLTGALETCYGNRKISLQQFSATFRRGDLLEMLENEN
ncbi:abortive phage resistance protein, partial [Deltaproteobacteria bacterium TL4]